MKDYIERQAAVDKVYRLKTRIARMSDYEVDVDEVIDMLDDLVGDIDDIPTADVRENVRGEWIYTPIENGMIVAMCPICKKVSAITPSVKEWYRFCPNCGADMRGEA